MLLPNEQVGQHNEGDLDAPLSWQRSKAMGRPRIRLLVPMTKKEDVDQKAFGRRAHVRACRSTTVARELIAKSLRGVSANRPISRPVRRKTVRPTQAGGLFPRSRQARVLNTGCPAKACGTVVGAVED